MPHHFRDGTKYGKRHVPGVMNKTEEEYASQLAILKQTGEVVEWWFEAMTFKLAPDTRYTPDFGVLYSDGVLEFVDCKSSAPIDPNSLTKIKCAAEKFPCFQFVIERKQANKDGGGWVRMVK